jgi:alpha-L-rhamnosidase
MLRLNRTTACERWDGEAGSLNHAALCSAIDEWFYSGLAGIRPDASEPGYEKIIFKPYLPSDLAWAQASVRTMRGVVRSAWRQANHQAQLDIEVPANSTGVVHIPCADAGKITESGAPVADAEGVTHSDSDKTSSVFVVGSGSYRFAFPVA